MRFFPLILFLLCFLAGCGDGKPAAPVAVVKEADGFYIWQRARPEALATALAAEPSEARFCYLSRELENWRTTPVACPESRLPKQAFVPVFRIHVLPEMEKALQAGRLQAWVLAELAAVRTEFQKRQIPLAELQLDLDCPERLLSDYGRFLKGLRPKLDGLRLSVTVLPCHLDRQAFRQVASACDEFILQVHGIEGPGTPEHPATLMKLPVALAAIKQATALGRPFRVALPAYGSRLVFSKKDGRFKGIASEEAAELPEAECRWQLCVPRPDEVLAVRQAALASPSCRGILWFRLPVLGDRLCWDRGTIRSLQENRLPVVGMKIRWEQRNDGSSELIVFNHGDLETAQATITIGWGQDRTHEYGLRPGTIPAGDAGIPGIVPVSLRFPGPPPGQSRPLAWFRLGKLVPPEIKSDRSD